MAFITSKFISMRLQRHLSLKNMDRTTLYTVEYDSQGNQGLYFKYT